MDIVDSQVHLFAETDDDIAMRIMDALGIRSAVIDEMWSSGGGGPLHATMPSYRLPSGHYRRVSPGGQLASMRRPDRFSYILWINPEDPEMEGGMADAVHMSGFRAFRLVASGPAGKAAAEAGGFHAFFKAAERIGAPVFVAAGGASLSSYEQYIRACSSLPITFDHCGMVRSDAQFDDLLRLGQYENVHLKWCHAPLYFDAKQYPFPEVRPYLARALQAFGRERIMWASDFNVIRYMRDSMGSAAPVYTWSQALYYLRDDPTLSDDDKAWLLGRTARKFLRWEVSDELKD